MGRKLRFGRSTNLKLLPRACAIRSIANHTPSLERGNEATAFLPL